MKIRFFSLLLCVFLPLNAYALNIEFFDTPLKDVVAYVTNLTGKTYIVNVPEDIQITWKKKDVSQIELIEQFKSVVQVYGMEIGEIDGNSVIQKPNGVVLENSIIAYQLKWIDSEVVAKALAEIWQDTISFASFKETILLSGPSASINQVLETVKRYDSPITLEIEKIRLQHITAFKAFEVIQKDIDIKDKVIADSWTNSLLVRGDNLLKIVVTNYARVLDVVEDDEILRVYHSNRELSETITENVKSMYPNIQIFSADTKTFVYRGVKDDVQRTTRLFQALDGVSRNKKNTQVVIKAVVSSLTDAAYKELGVNLGYMTGDIDFSVGGLAKIYDPTVLLSLIGSTVTGSIAASEADGQNFIITEPSLMVLSGQEAEILVGQEIPVKVSESVDDTGSVTDTKIERMSVGVKLTVLPVVEDGVIRLELTQEISSIDENTTDTVDIVTNSERLKTSLCLSNGQTLVIGGLKVNASGVSKDGVPILKNIPLIGAAFGYEKNKSESRNIVMSLTASIMESSYN